MSLYLLSLGELAAVNNLTCRVQSQYINCSWSPPFFLEGVPIYGYIINVTNEGDNTQYTTTSNTTSWIYCPNRFGNYTVSIAGNNSAGEGKISIKEVSAGNDNLRLVCQIMSNCPIHIDTITSFYVIPKRLSNGTYFVNYIVKV